MESPRRDWKALGRKTQHQVFAKAWEGQSHQDPDVARVAASWVEWESTRSIWPQVGLAFFGFAWASVLGFVFSHFAQQNAFFPWGYTGMLVSIAVAGVLIQRVQIRQLKLVSEGRHRRLPRPSPLGFALMVLFVFGSTFAAILGAAQISAAAKPVMSFLALSLVPCLTSAIAFNLWRAMRRSTASAGGD